MSNLSTVGAVAFLLVLGCGGAPRQSDTPLNDEARRALALAATNALRETFNKDGCGAIYSEASDSFRSQQPREPWMNECRRLRGKVGDWGNFEVQLVAACAPSNEFICLSGSATFASGAYHVVLVYRLETGRARLDSFFLSNGEKWAFPPPQGHRRYHYDPPPRDPSRPRPS